MGTTVVWLLLHRSANIHTHARTRARAHTHMRSRAHTDKNTNMHARTQHARTHTHARTHAPTPIRAHIALTRESQKYFPLIHCGSYRVKDSIHKNKP